MSRQALSRRALLASSLALVACDQAGGATAQARPGGPLPRLRDLAPFPIGTQIVTDQFAVPVITELASTQFDQITTGYELKMEYLVQPDGRLRFDGPDRIADFCRRNGQTMQGHTLIWYADTPDWCVPPELRGAYIPRERALTHEEYGKLLAKLEPKPLTP